VAIDVGAVKMAKIRSLKDSVMLYGTLLRQAGNVVFLRMTGVGRARKGDDFMISLSGVPELICLARLTDEPPKAEKGPSDGVTLRFTLLTELCPIGLL
jgi:hypothetical protein